MPRLFNTILILKVFKVSNDHKLKLLCAHSDCFHLYKDT